MRSRVFSIVAAGAALLTLVGCAGGSGGTADGAEEIATDDGHGEIAGAAEVPEPQLGLTTIDPSGAVVHLDLLDESVTEIGRVGSPTGITTDGRYLFAETREGLDIVDSGVWTWDHGDHFHYYRAEPRVLGVVDGDGPATVATTNLSTAGGTGVFFAGSGDAVLLDTEALSKGSITERFRKEGEPHAGLVVPVGSFAVISQAEDGVASAVAAYTADGDPTGVEEVCAEASGTITTRVGAVIGCRDGALLARVDDGALTLTRIPYPDGTTAPAATSFSNREGRPTVAALAGTEGIWMLDTREQSWTLLPAPEPLVAVTAVDDHDENLLALTADGRLLVLNGADGAVKARTEPLVAASLDAGHRPALIVDQQRAYLSAPTERRLYEIDFVDDARVARSFDTASEPAFTAGTGR